MDDVQRNALVAVGVTFMGGAIAWGSTLSLVARHSVLVRFAFPVGMFIIGSTLVIIAIRSKGQTQTPPQPTPQEAPLGRAIRNGQALASEMSPKEAITSQRLADEWKRWERETIELLSEHFGPAAVREFQSLQAYGKHPAVWIPKQIEFLEVQQKRRFSKHEHG